MATTRKGKTAAKKASINLTGTIPSVKLNMPLDEKKIAAIHRCIAKGSLSITLSKVDLVRGKLGDPYIYD